MKALWENTEGFNQEEKNVLTEKETSILSWDLTTSVV